MDNECFYFIEQKKTGHRARKGKTITTTRWYSKEKRKKNKTKKRKKSNEKWNNLFNRERDFILRVTKKKKKDMYIINILIQWTTTCWCTTTTWNFLFFKWKFIIISYFFSQTNITSRIDNNFLLRFNRNYFRITIRLK